MKTNWNVIITSKPSIDPKKAKWLFLSQSLFWPQDMFIGQRMLWKLPSAPNFFAFRTFFPSSNWKWRDVCNLSKGCNPLLFLIHLIWLFFYQLWRLLKVSCSAQDFGVFVENTQKLVQHSLLQCRHATEINTKLWEMQIRKMDSRLRL